MTGGYFAREQWDAAARARFEETPMPIENLASHWTTSEQSVFDAKLEAIVDRAVFPKQVIEVVAEIDDPVRDHFIATVKEMWPGASVTTHRMEEKLVRVIMPTAVAGFLLRDNIVRECAPILRKHLMGKTDAQCRALIKANKWTAFVVKEKTEDMGEMA